jgi:hypothetical protein
VNTPRPIARLQHALRDDRGMGIIEVLSALTIFAIITVGMAFSLVAMTRMTFESQNREVATNLAAAEIDRLHAVGDAFKVFSTTEPLTPKTVDGIDYYVRSSVAWVSTTGASGACGSGGGNLQYKRVNVDVTWDGMVLDSGVHADTVMAPATRINDPSYGTVLVSVLGVDGTGRSGVTVRVSPESGGGGSAVTTTISPTDADGCSYVLKVAPGLYKVEVEQSGYVDVAQTSVPALREQQVVAGATTTASFQYDQAGTFTVDYAANSTSDPALPSNLDTTFVGGLANYVRATPSSTVKLHPYSSGYQVLAGNPAGKSSAGTCLSVDPANWLESDTLEAGVRIPAAAAAAGGSATLPVPMGVLTVTMPERGYITAIQQSTGTGGDPGCAKPTTYTFNTRYNTGTVASIALPYGSWLIYTDDDFGVPDDLVPAANLTITDASTGFLNGGTGELLTGEVGESDVTGAGAVTLDPRQPK